MQSQIFQTFFKEFLLDLKKGLYNWCSFRSWKCCFCHDHCLNNYDQENSSIPDQLHFCKCGFSKRKDVSLYKYLLPQANEKLRNLIRINYVIYYVIYL